MLGVRQKAGHSLLDILKRYLSGGVLPDHPPEHPARLAHVSLAGKDMCRPGTIAAEVDSALCRNDLGFGVQGQPESCDRIRCGVQGAPCSSLVGGNDYEVVHISDIPPDARAIRHGVIQLVQHDIGGELTRQSADRKADAIMAIPGGDPFPEVKSILAGDNALNGREQHIMSNTGEIALDVGLYDIRSLPVPMRHTQHALQRPHGSLRALARPAGITVIDEPPLEQRLYHPDQGVVDNSVRKWRSLNIPALGFKNRETAGLSSLPASPYEMVMYIDKVLFQVDTELRHFTAVPLAFSRGQIRAPQVVEVDDSGE